MKGLNIRNQKNLMPSKWFFLFSQIGGQQNEFVEVVEWKVAFFDDSSSNILIGQTNYFCCWGLNINWKRKFSLEKRSFFKIKHDFNAILSLDRWLQVSSQCKNARHLPSFDRHLNQSMTPHWIYRVKKLQTLSVKN